MCACNQSPIAGIQQTEKYLGNVSSHDSPPFLPVLYIAHHLSKVIFNWIKFGFPCSFNIIAQSQSNCIQFVNSIGSHEYTFTPPLHLPLCSTVYIRTLYTVCHTFSFLPFVWLPHKLTELALPLQHKTHTHTHEHTKHLSLLPPFNYFINLI